MLTQRNYKVITVIINIVTYYTTSPFFEKKGRKTRRMLQDISLFSLLLLSDFKLCVTIQMSLLCFSLCFIHFFVSYSVINREECFFLFNLLSMLYVYDIWIFFYFLFFLFSNNVSAFVHVYCSIFNINSI